jgi:tetratricopeptide (TPR) repeat protein
VLDNLETLLEAARGQDAGALELTEFIQRLPSERTSLLCTSRHLSGWNGERSLELGGLSPEEGAMLFQQCAPARFAEIELPLARRLSEHIDGHPLGLSLLGKAFNAAGTITLKDFLADHETYLREAENVYIGLEHRQRTLYANVAYSVRWLSEDLRATFSQLWIFHAPFLPEVAASVLDPTHEAEASGPSLVEQHLYTLWQRGLLMRETLAVGEKQVSLYRLPPVMRPYVKRELAEESRSEELLKRFCQANAWLAQQIYSELVQGRAIAPLALRCYDDLMRGTSCVEERTEGSYHLHWGWILHQLGDQHKAVATTELALERAEGRNRSLEGRALHNLGLMFHATGQPHRALRFYEQALVITREVGDRPLEGTALNNLARVYHELGDKRQALKYYQQALTIRQEVDDRPGEGATLHNLGGVYHDLGDKQKTLEYYQRALAIAREVDNHALEGTTLNNLGGAYDALGDKRQALKYYQQALAIARGLGDRRGEGITLNNLGRIYEVLGDKQKTLEYYQQALTIAGKVGDRRGEGTALNNLGNVYDLLGDKQRALEYSQQALAIAKEVDNRRGESTALNNLGSVCYDMGDKQQALEYYQQALAIRREVGDRRGEGTILNNLGRVYDEQDNKQQALKYYQQALVIRREVGDRHGEGTTLNNLGSVCYDMGDKQQALEYYRQALTIAREIGNRHGEGMTLYNLGRVYGTQGDKQQALEYYRQALTIAREVSDRALEGTTLHSIGVMYANFSRFDVALACFLLAKTIFEYIQSPSPIDDEVQSIATLREQLGEERFVALFAHVEPWAGEIVNRALQENAPFPSTLPTELIATIKGITIAVMTTMSEQQVSWREVIARMLQVVQDTQQHGPDWYIEEEFFLALLALLDEQPPSLAVDHPYAPVLAAIQDGIARGRLAASNENEDESKNEGDEQQDNTPPETE